MKFKLLFYTKLLKAHGTVSSMKYEEFMLGKSIQCGGLLNYYCTLY